MSLTFGHNDLEPNHIHDIKPLVALPYYQQTVREYELFHTSISYNTLKGPIPIKDHWPRIDIIAKGWIEEKNTQLVLLAHTFDVDNVIRSLKIKYELKCIMIDDSIERRLI